MFKTKPLLSQLAAIVLLASTTGAAELQRIWLTHQNQDHARLVVNFESTQPGNAVVEFGPTPALGQRIEQADASTLHHVEIPAPRDSPRHFYRVQSGMETSAIQSFEGYPTEQLRVVVVGNIGYSTAPWADAVLKEKPNLLISVGDNVPALHEGTPVPAATTAAFSRLVERWPALFASTPWMPLLGNHDREMRPRGPTPPADPVYDIDAKAFREFFALPGVEWRWRLDFPEFGARFAALDLSHLSDMGTTWQTCHSFARDQAQFAAYSLLLDASRQKPFFITLYNEQNSKVRSLEDGDWGRLLTQGSLAISGFGYFGERADLENSSFFNTSTNGTGDQYPDPKSAALKARDNYLLLTFHKAPARLHVDLKSLDDTVLDSKDFEPRSAQLALP